MTTIKFKAKAYDVRNVDGSLAFSAVNVPTLTHSHCDMAAFRQHPKFGGLANSDLFPNLLAKIKRDRLGDSVRFDKIPEGVTVDATGFLALVTVEV
jgi:hypothetical protein